MPRDTEEIINEPIDPEEFKTEDLPEDDEETEIIDLEDEEDEEINIEDEEIDPIGDSALGLDSSEFDDELKKDDLSDLPDDEQINQPKIIAPENQVRWSPIPKENGDIWSEHIDGFVLRARPLSAQNNNKMKYIAQLFKDNKSIEKGVIYIEKEKDAREFLQNVADRILDRMSLVNMSKKEAKSEDEIQEYGETEQESDLEDIETDIDTAL